MAIADEVCKKQGHRIQSLVIGQKVIPATTIIVDEYLVICTQCGKPHAEITKERLGRSNSKPKPKPVIPDPPQPPANLEV